MDYIGWNVEEGVEFSDAEDAYWEAEQAALEAAWDEQAAREAAAQAFYDSLSSEKLEALLKEGNRICASSLK